MTPLPIKRDLAPAYLASLLVAGLIALVSIAGLALGPTGLYQTDARTALGVTASSAGILVPGFLAPLALLLRRVAADRPGDAAWRVGRQAG